MSTVEDAVRNVDIMLGARSGPVAVPGGRLPAHVAVVAERDVDLEPYGDGELTDAELVDHAGFELLEARLRGIAVRGCGHAGHCMPVRRAVRQERRLARAELTAVLRVLGGARW